MSFLVKFRNKQDSHCHYCYRFVHCQIHTGCQKNIKLFIPLLVLSSLHTKKIIPFYKITYFYTVQDKKRHKFLFASLNSTHSMFIHRISYHQSAILQDHLKKQAAELPCVDISVYLPVLYAICFIIAGTVSCAPQKTSLNTQLGLGA